MHNVKEWNYHLWNGLRALEGAQGSKKWINRVKHGLKDNLQTLSWRIQKQIEKGSKDGTVSGEGMRKLSTTLRKLVPMANFTIGEASESAEKFIAWVETYGI